MDPRRTLPAPVMKRSSLVVALAALGALPLVLLWLWASGQGPAGAGATPAVLSAAGERSGDAELAEGTAETDGADPRGRGVPEAPAPAALSPASGEASIEGRVVLPEGCWDAEVEVFALETSSAYGPFARIAAAEPGTQGVLGRAAVGADGSFRLALARPVRRAHLMLRGRFVYLPRTRAVTLEGGNASAVLYPVEGAHLAARFAAPPPVAADLRLRARIQADDGNFFQNASREGVSLALDAPPSGFEVRALPAGTPYVLTIESEEFAGLRVELQGLEPGEERELILSLARGGGARGRVVDADGAPAPGARVRALVAGRWFGLDDVEVRAARADAEGRFALERLPVGRVALVASSAGALDSPRRSVEVSEGSSQEGLVLELAQGRTLAGRVQWPDGSAAPGVAVTIEFDAAFLGGPAAMNATRGAQASALTDAAGRFEAGGLGAGPFVVRAAAEGEDGRRFRARADGVAPITEGTEGAGAALDLSLVLRPPLGVAGRVVDQEGEPLEAFEVRATRLATGSLGETATETVVASFEDAEGRFFLEGLIEGRWKLEAEADGFATSEPVTLALPVDPQAEPLSIAMVRTARASGVVRAPDGTPVAGAEVIVDTGVAEWQRMMGGQSAPKTVSRAEGRFEIEGLLPGKLGLFADARDFARGATRALDLQPGQHVEGVELPLALGGTLTGLVFAPGGEPAGGQTVIATHMSTFEQRVTETDSKGELAMQHLQAGSWSIVAMSAESSALSEGELDFGAMASGMQMSQAKIADGETTHVVIGSPPEHPVHVHGVVTHAGEPYANAVVSFYPEGTKLYERLKVAATDAEGKYATDLDQPGVYVVFVQVLPGGPGQQHTIEFSREVPEADEHELDLELPLGRISGRVVAADGAPAKGARLTLTVDGGAQSDTLFGGQYTEILTGGDGSYDVQALRPGVYRVSAGGSSLFNPTEAGPHGRLTRGGLELEEGEWLEGVDFRLEEPGAIEALVSDGAGRPVGRASVFVRDAEGRVVEPFSMAQTDGAGRCMVRGLAPGEYTLVARSSLLASEESPAVRVRAGETSAVRLSLAEGTILRVVLFERDEGTPARAVVRVRDAEGREMGGMFSMQDLETLYMNGAFSPTEHRLGPLAPGRYEITARAADGRSATKRVLLGGAPEKRVTLRLE